MPNGGNVMDENNHRETTATLGRRVERLERGQDALSIRVESFKEVVDLKLEMILNKVNTNSAELEAFIMKIENLIKEGLEKQADIRSTPLGRQLDDRLNKMEAEVQSSREDRLNRQSLGYTVKTYIIPVLAIIASVAAVVLNFVNP